MLKVVHEGIKKNELKGVDPVKFTMFIWGRVHSHVSLLQPEMLLGLATTDIIRTIRIRRWGKRK